MSCPKLSYCQRIYRHRFISVFVGCKKWIPRSFQMTGLSSDSTETIANERSSETESRPGDSDQNRIAIATGELKRAGWYWGNLTANEAKEILQDTTEGTFLVRDSSQQDYLFTISAKTSVGPTNLRIEYRDGKFRLDSFLFIKPRLKQFDTVVSLVEHYVYLSRISKSSESASPPNGTVQLLLTKPVYASTPALQHLCRISINKATKRIEELPLPNRIKNYLTEYTYHV